MRLLSGARLLVSAASVQVVAALWLRASRLRSGRVQHTTGLSGTAPPGTHLSFVEWAERLTSHPAEIYDRDALLSEVVPFVEQEHPAALSALPPGNASHVPMSSEECRAAGGGGRFTGTRKFPAKVIDVSLVGFDLDIYEVKLHELHDDIDIFFAIEMPWTHKGAKKPLLWRRNMQTRRFQAVRSKVVSIVVDSLPPGSSTSTNIWQFEGWQEDEGMRLVRRELEAKGLKPGEVIMVFGDADEVVAPSLVRFLRFCEPVKLPMDIGTWMPMGLFSHAFRTDWPVDKSLPYTFGNPAVHDPHKPKGLKWRMFGEDGLFLLGGWHLTDYLYPPHMLLKTISMTEGDGHTDWFDLHALGGHLEEYTAASVQRRMSRIMNVTDLAKQDPYVTHPELLKPPSIMSRNPMRYESWYGTLDRRCSLKIPWAPAL